MTAGSAKRSSCNLLTTAMNPYAASMDPNRVVVSSGVYSPHPAKFDETAKAPLRVIGFAASDCATCGQFRSMCGPPQPQHAIGFLAQACPYGAGAGAGADAELLPYLPPPLAAYASHSCHPPLPFD